MAYNFIPYSVRGRVRAHRATAPAARRPQAGTLAETWSGRCAAVAIALFLALRLSIGAAAAQVDGGEPGADPALYGALPDVTEAKISPSGRYVATLRNVGARKAVLIYDLERPDAAPTGVAVGDEDARGINWANDEHLLLLLSASDTVNTTNGLKTLEFFRWLVISRSKGKAEMLFGNEAGYLLPSAGDFLAVRADDPTRAIFSRYAVRGGYTANEGAGSRLSGKRPFQLALFEVNLNNGRRRKIEGGEEDTVNWIVNKNGDAVIRVDYDRKTEKRRVYVREADGSRFRLLMERDQPRGRGAPLVFHGLSPDQTHALATTYGDRDKRSLVRIDLKTGETIGTAFSHAEYDIDSISYEPLGGAVIGVFYTDHLPRIHYLTEETDRVVARLDRALPNASPHIVSESSDMSRMIVEATYPDHPKQFFLFDRDAKRLDMIAASYEALDAKPAAFKEPYVYTASDGLDIPGYLTSPKDARAGKMPLIVLPHGGPEIRDSQAFDWWSFFYAARGYRVYQPNFRGSDGYGGGFRSAGHREWGSRMQDDITEGVRRLIDDGLADPERICIVGASYGGYAALAGAAMTPDLYACAVSVNGIGDLMALVGSASRSSEFSEDILRVRVGDRFRDAAEIKARSPVNLVENIKAPVLLIHSEDDTVVSSGQSVVMRDRLREAGKPHDYVELPGEDHWLSTSEMRTEMLRRSIAFIDAHIGG